MVLLIRLNLHNIILGCHHECRNKIVLGTSNGFTNSGFRWMSPNYRWRLNSPSHNTKTHSNFMSTILVPKYLGFGDWVMSSVWMWNDLWIVHIIWVIEMRMTILANRYLESRFWIWIYKCDIQSELIMFSLLGFGMCRMVESTNSWKKNQNILKTGSCHLCTKIICEFFE